MSTNRWLLSGRTLAALLIAGLLATGPAQAGQYANTAAAGGQNIVEGAAGADNLKTLVTAVKAADLIGTLSGEGPFTVFAPTDEAFARLPEGTLEVLLKPENRGQLQSILTYHVVPTRATAEAVIGLIRDGGGEATVQTVQGGTLTLMLESGQRVVVEDEQGNIATVEVADIMQSNGVVHVIDTVLLPAG